MTLVTIFVLDVSKLEMKWFDVAGADIAGAVSRQPAASFHCWARPVGLYSLVHWVASIRGPGQPDGGTDSNSVPWLGLQIQFSPLVLATGAVQLVPSRWGPVRVLLRDPAIPPGGQVQEVIKAGTIFTWFSAFISIAYPRKKAAESLPGDVWLLPNCWHIQTIAL